MIRAFLGLDLPGDIRSALAVQQFLLPLPRRVDPALMHLTLVFLGEVPEPALEAAHEGFAALKVAPFPLALQGLGLFGGTRPKVAWAGVAPSEPLMRLQSRAEHAARQAGLAPEHRRFAPHVTLGRFPPPAFAQAAALERAVAETPFAAGPWQVQDMVLWQSHLSPKGPRYEELARYPFS
ncbi:RNA 2',3'-cyclic phosphodiesterase [Rhodobacter sp. SGA-6-6]|uniref:RNA 2',3'-cyclic phosphodiesterase n=1 Tax=Rhodobacter sp. SGA-6-6 TaxID=2710882 RepID=UPI0013EA8882|nr:RNA 2',3'-cyclic phosphodiesterase [Rhodobacter sp. SGA-6-6]NGM46493.1 RNA 2',3'-cyclic phosphodiesterase [Rhodobacter sp. SGA-6-6]